MQPIQPLRLAVGKAFFVLFLQVFILQTRSQSIVTVTYAGSGIPINTNGTVNVLASNPIVDGYEHQLLSDAYPPQFDGTSLILYGQNLGSQGSYVLSNTVIEISYPFQSNYTYYVAINYYPQSVTQYTGVGISVGPPQLTNNATEMGTVMNNYYNSNRGSLFANNFLANPIYSTFIPISSVDPTTLNIPPFPITTATTGLNLETLPNVSILSPGFSSLDIQSIAIVGVPMITASSTTICSSETLSVPNPNNWPVSWSVSPSSVATLSSSGNSATVTKVSNGGATITANYTAPNGNNYATTLPVQVGTLPEPVSITPSSGTTGPNATDAFIAVGADHWAVGNGTLLGGQGTDAASVKVANVTSGYLSVVASASNACGTNGSRVATLTITSGGGGGFLNFTSGLESASVDALTSSAGPINGPQLYPNPATNSFQVIQPVTDFIRAYIKIYDINGRLVQAIVPNSQYTLVDASRWAKGTYIVAIFDGEQLTTKKFVKL